MILILFCSFTNNKLEMLVMRENKSSNVENKILEIIQQKIQSSKDVSFLFRFISQVKKKVLLFVVCMPKTRQTFKFRICSKMENLALSCFKINNFFIILILENNLILGIVVLVMFNTMLVLVFYYLLFILILDGLLQPQSFNMCPFLPLSVRNGPCQSWN